MARRGFPTLGIHQSGALPRSLSVLTTFVIGIITGALGVAYIVYGRRQTKFVPLIAGVFLCAYPYFIDSLVWLCVVGALLLAAPFVIDF